MIRLIATHVLLSAVLLAPMSALPQGYDEFAESPRRHQLEIKFGPYTPDMDSEGINTYALFFDNESMFMTRLEYDYQFWQDWGSLAIGAEIGYGQITGNGLATGTGEATSDETSLNMLPTSLSLVYHLDVAAIRWGIPLVPYVKVGVDYTLWWITNGIDETSTYESPTPNADGTVTVFDGEGDTFGWHVAGGIKLLLDTMAPKMAQTFDTDAGVNNSYLFVEFLYADISDFGSDTSFQLGDMTVFLGLAFEF